MADTIRNINLGLNSKKRFTVDGDENKIIELDTSDINLVTRLSDSLEMMSGLKEKWDELTAKSAEYLKNPETIDSNDSIEFAELFKELETRMREIVDFVFDSKGLCDIILGNSSIFTPVNGKVKYEQIIDGLTTLYEESIQAETDKLNTRKVANKTAKYIK